MVNVNYCRPQRVQITVYSAYGNREYPGNFQNSVYSVPGQTEGERKAILEWKSIDISLQLTLTCGVYYKSDHNPIPTREHLGSFQKNPVSSAFNRVCRYILFLARLKGNGRPFVEDPTTLGCQKRRKNLFF